MRTVTFSIKNNLDLSEKEIVEELLLTETKMNSESRLRFHLSQESVRIDELERKIEAYRMICKLAGIPKFITENPEAFSPDPITREDLKWTKKKIAEYKEK